MPVHALVMGDANLTMEEKVILLPPRHFLSLQQRHLTAS